MKAISNTEQGMMNDEVNRNTSDFIIPCSIFIICCFVFSLCLLPSAFLHGQSKIDSLLTLLKKDKEDTNKVNHLKGLCFKLELSNPDTAIILCNQALSLAENLQWKKGIAGSLHNIGNVYRDQGNYPKALDYYFKALKINEETGNKKWQANNFGSIGSVYVNQADYPKALDYYFKALKMDEELGNKNGIANILGNIGIVYHQQCDYPKALDYNFKALKMDEELGNKNGIARHLGNIGSVYKEQADYPKVHPVERDSLLNRALDYYFKALKMDEELGNKNSIAAWLGNIGDLYTNTKKYAEAEKYLLEALKRFKEIGAQDYESQIEESLTDLYTKTNRYQLALEHYKKAMVLKDTLFSAEKNKEITRKEMNYEFEKKEAAAAAAAEKHAAVAAAEKRKQQIVLLLVIAVLLVVAVFAGFIYRSLRITQKQKRIIEKQKKLVEEKQKEILDSIHYARRIQTALLPTEKYIEKTFNRLKEKMPNN